jgi:putative membrane protein
MCGEQLEAREKPENLAASVREDDPRVILAAQRTLLAWIRTGLAMMGFGFLVAKFGLFLRELMILQGGQPTGTPRWSVWIGAAMITLGAVANLVTGIEHWRYSRQLRSVPERFRRGYRMGIASAILLAGVGAMMVVYIAALQ